MTFERENNEESNGEDEGRIKSEEKDSRKGAEQSGKILGGRDEQTQMQQQRMELVRVDVYVKNTRA